MWVNNLPKVATQWNSGTTRDSNRGHRARIPSALTTRPLSHKFYARFRYLTHGTISAEFLIGDCAFLMSWTFFGVFTQNYHEVIGGHAIIVFGIWIELVSVYREARNGNNTTLVKMRLFSSFLNAFNVKLYHSVKFMVINYMILIIVLC